MTINHFFSENIILPFSDYITGNKVNHYLKFLQESQWWLREQIDKYQNQRLHLLIRHSVNTVPYYHMLFKDLKLSPDDIKSKEDLTKLPILTKADIKRQGKEKFTSSAFPKKRLINASSSGSTGEPLFYYNTKDAYSMNIAANLRGWYWMGYRLGDKYMKLSQNSRKNPIKILQDKMSRNRYLATNPLNESNFDFLLKKIEKYKPKIIRCYPDPLFFLAQFKKKHGGYKYQPLAINTTGNTLHPETRDCIESAFGCNVFDSYSCEGNSNIFECSTHECYHSTEEYGISEIIDENGKLINDGVGKLISTDLHNFAHPFIRYDTQDLVEVSSDSCSCGRKLLRINQIFGRDSDVIDTPNGKYIIHDFTIFFALQNTSLNKSVNQFQVIKKKDKSIVFNLVINSFFNEEVKNYIKSYWENQFNLPVTINIVAEIPLTKSGKRRFIINET